MHGLELRRFLPLALLAGACMGPADLPEQSVVVGRQGPIVYGEPDLDPAHAAVVFVLMGHEGGCTGTLIAPDVVLTAAHCVAPVESPTDLRVGFGRAVGYSMTWIPVAEARYHDDYDADWPAYDIALIRLARPAPEDIEPIPYLPAELRITQEQVSAGVELHFAGFGKTESGGSGRMLQVRDTVELACENEAGCPWGTSPYAPRMAPWTLCYDQKPGGPCSGDSGGPAFVTIDGVEYVAGVTSYGDENCAFFGCSTKVDVFEDFIAGFLGGRNGIACTSGAECGSGHCVDGICCHTACTGTCSSCSLPDRVGICSPLPNGSPCDDDNLCTLNDQCLDAVCTPTEYVGCRAPTVCRPAVECNPQTGLCEGPPAADGTPCEKGTCESGECVAPKVAVGCGGCASTNAVSLLAWGAVGLWAFGRRRGQRI